MNFKPLGSRVLVQIPEEKTKTDSGIFLPETSTKEGFHFLGAFPLALAAGQLGWEVAITGAAGLSLATTIWFAFVRRGAPKLGRQEAAAA